MKKILYTLFLLFILPISYADYFGTDKISDTFKNGNNPGDLVGAADNTLGYLIGLLYFIAVAIGIYGGFQILVSGGDEERVKKGKNYLVYMVIGLIIVFLASIIVRWVIDVMTNEVSI